MDYNNGNNNMNMGNQGMPGPGMPNPGMPGPGIPNQGMPNQGMPNQGIPNPGMPYPGMPNRGMPGPGIPNPGMPGQGMPNQGMPNQGMPRQGMPNPGMPYQGPAGSNMRSPLADRNAPTQADIASSRLAREIEKSVRGEDRNDKPDLPPDMSLGLKRAGRTPGRMPGQLPSITIPSGLIEGISGFSAYIFGAILVLCLIISLVAYGKDHKGGSVGGKKASIPSDMYTYTGIFRNVYEAAASGTLTGGGTQTGALYDDDGTLVPAAPTAIGEETAAATDPDDYDPTAQSGTDDTESSESSSSSGSYGQAESYKELLDQLEKAIAAGDSAFVASKMAYEDENGTLKAFPQTVVDHFVTYMSSNSDKRSSLMTDLSSDKYSGQNEGEFIVKLPYIKFVVNMGYDNTTISLPGFSDQVVNAGQSADIAPLMPCMYTLTISNPDWNDVVTRDIEANINESTISINIKP